MPSSIHVFVALADNASQGIVPVPPRIGNGDRPDENLYWGNEEGFAGVFSSSSYWQRIPNTSPPPREVLERRTLRHKRTEAVLVADAYRGKEIKRAITDLFAAAATPPGNPRELIAYLGHNGLMEFTVPLPKGQPGRLATKDAILLCCTSDAYFSPTLKRLGTRPLLTTTQLMYPGSFILHDALEGWLRHESPAQIRERAGRAYAKNQKITFKSALGIFQKR